MCGIVLTIGVDSEKKTKNALNQLKHRGVDDFSVINIKSDISLGFRRFAINDLSIKGRQPFIHNNFVGAFNGEVYNYLELKDKYEINTISKTDTEIILPLYQKFQDNFYDLIDGMFAGIIFDKQKNKIIVIKDIIGKKPLFLVRTKENIFFVSELKTIKERVISFFNIKSGVSKFNIKGELLSNKYQNIKIEVPTLCSNSNNLFELLKEAVNKRIPSEKFGIFLSGGLDSSIITYLALHKTKNIIFYSLIDKNSSDYQNVIELVKYLGINTKNIRYINIPDNDEIEELINKVVYHTESYNPSIISNGIGTYILAKEAKKDGLKVILSGEGADEIFCGYKSFFSKGQLRKNWKELRIEFIENLYFTEVRRVDLCTMAHTIEARSPFLDMEIIKYANRLDNTSFFKNNVGKQILRNIFKQRLPNKITSREKVSFDVGSGIRKIVVRYLKSREEFISEKDELKQVWNQYYNNYYNEICNEEYFHSYPSFNNVIANRGIK